MKYISSFFFLLSFAALTHAQQSGTVLATRHAKTYFEAQVRQELAGYSHGTMLYRRCDVFARMINRRVAARLGMQSYSTMSEAADTSLVGDISNSVENQNETSIAISRTNPNIMVVGANDDAMYSLSMPAYVSTDAGNTWGTYRVPNPDSGIDEMTAAGDPIITSDDAGNFYYSFLIEGTTDSEFDNVSDLMVAHSSNGMNWTLGTSVLGLTAPIGAFEDKEIIAIDRDLGSRYHGRLYIAWNEFDSSGAIQHLLAHSDDQAQTWSSPIAYTQTYGFFPLVRIGKQGTLFIASSTEDDTDVASDNTHGMTVSTDGGLTFSENIISNYTLFPPNPNGYPGLKGDYGFRAFPYVAFDVDPSNNAIDAVFGSYEDSDGDAALFAVQSMNNGQTWSNPQQVGTPDLLGNDHFMPWVSHDDVTGETNISLFSSEEDTVVNLNSRSVRCTFSTTSQMQNIGYRLFDPLVDTIDGWDFIGDYAGNDAFAGCFAAAWTENRPVNNDDGDIFAYVSSPLSSVSGTTRQINAEEFDVTSISPNPVVGDFVTFTIASSDQLLASIRVFDLRGNEVLTSQQMMDPSVQNVVTLDVRSLAAGVYHTQISCGVQSIQKNFVVLR